MSKSSDPHIDSYDFETILSVVSDLARANPGKSIELTVREVFQDLCGARDCPVDFITAVTVAASLRGKSEAEYYARKCGITLGEAERMMREASRKIGA